MRQVKPPGAVRAPLAGWFARFGFPPPGTGPSAAPAQTYEQVSKVVPWVPKINFRLNFGHLGHKLYPTAQVERCCEPRVSHGTWFDQQFPILVNPSKVS